MSDEELLELKPYWHEVNACRNMWEIALKLKEARRLAEELRDMAYANSARLRKTFYPDEECGPRHVRPLPWEEQ